MDIFCLNLDQEHEHILSQPGSGAWIYLVSTWIKSMNISCLNLDQEHEHILSQPGSRAWTYPVSTWIRRREWQQLSKMSKIGFPKNPGIWEISQLPGYQGNFPNAWVSGKFLGTWEISQMSGYLGNFPNTYRYLRVVNF